MRRYDRKVSVSLILLAAFPRQREVLTRELLVCEMDWAAFTSDYRSIDTEDGVCYCSSLNTDCEALDFGKSNSGTPYRVNSGDLRRVDIYPPSQHLCYLFLLTTSLQPVKYT